MNAPDIKRLYQQGYIAAIDWALCGFIDRVAPGTDPWVLLAVALTSHATSQGHVCLDLHRAIKEGLTSPENDEVLPVPLSAENWVQRLNSSPAVGRPGDFRPLIVDGTRLYLHRYWHDERYLADSLLQRCRTLKTTVLGDALTQALDDYFPDKESDQRKAAYCAVTQAFSVISGGPGTGKTYTLAHIMLLLLRLHGSQTLRVKLAAPTGKAAARMQESITLAVEKAMHKTSAMPALQAEAQTIHRLLGIVPGQGRSRYDAGNQLPADVVIVDEASMIDLTLMTKLLRAIPPDARLILIGDKDQLSSVEAGAVLGDICHGVTRTDYKPVSAGRLKRCMADNTDPGALSGSITVLQKNFRFADAGGIGALSRAINHGDHKQVLTLLADVYNPSISLIPIRQTQELGSHLQEEVLATYGPLFNSDDPLDALARLNRFKILTAVRQGVWGAPAVNHLVENLLRRHGFIQHQIGRLSDWYAGRPVMITRNDYFHHLFNGDLGIAFQEKNRLQVAFPDNRGGMKYLAPYQLPAHETVYAMTVHKSQGSEFDHVVLVLPDQDVPVLTRELLYTAVTRARTSVLILGRPELLAKAVQRRVTRTSGLRDALWP